MHNSINELTYIIRGIAFKIHSTLGPGLLESVYERIFMHELEKAGLKAKSQVAIPLIYEGLYLETAFRLDILVEDKVVIELKSVEHLTDIHHKQLLTYLKLSKKSIGLLINFNVADLKTGIVRVVNNLEE
jgi:GxxExxY protein